MTIEERADRKYIQGYQDKEWAVYVSACKEQRDIDKNNAIESYCKICNIYTMNDNTKPRSCQKEPCPPLEKFIKVFESESC